MLDSILTLGPASSEDNVINALLSVAGRFRLNTSHMNSEQLEYWLKKLEQIFVNKSRQIGVVIDLQGSKMRIGHFPSVDSLPDKVSILYADSSKVLSEIPVPHKEFFKAVKTGDLISLNDARILLKITDASENLVKADVVRNNRLSSNKGINRALHPIPFEELTQKDKEMIRISMRYEFTEFAFSFTLDGSEAQKLRPLTQNRKLIAKIERSESMEYLKAIDREFDEMWLCRGDLGAQAGIFELGKLQEEFASQINEFKSPCILAGQVLEYMTHFPEPTRSEVVHLYDTHKKGFKGFVLSDETAVGKNPLAIAEFLKCYANKSS